MDLHQTSLIESLSDAHLVRQWWEGRLKSGGAVDAWPARPKGDVLDAQKAPSGRRRANRHLLLDVLRHQYAVSSMAEPAVLKKLGSEDARTVTTGHQLCLAGGPAFVVYKVLTAVQCAAWLEARWGSPVIPVFWLASEDHDFDEINGLWDGEGWHRWSAGSQSGAVGRMDARSSKETMAQWIESAGVSPEKGNRLLSAAAGSMATAMRQWIHEVIGPDRILVLDGDDTRLKGAFADQMTREVSEGLLFREVTRVNEVLQKEGHHPQVHVRETNLFHLVDRGRHRLIKEGSEWRAGGVQWKGDGELLDAIAENPASFSPNALFRPLYQSFLLPDIAVVGGLAEVGYWLQLTTAFEAFGLSRPVLIPRDGGRIMPAEWRQVASRFGVSRSQFEQDLTAWESNWLHTLGGPSAKSWREAVDREAADALERFSELDATLAGSVGAARAKMHKLLDKMDGQARRALRRQHSNELNELGRLRHWLHPDGQKQERVANIHFLEARWTESTALIDALECSFFEGHRGKDWRPVLHDLMGGEP